MDSAALETVQAWLREAPQIAVLTGAGVSAESGVPTFRDAQTGYWARFKPEDLATEAAFRRDPERVWDWYAERRASLAAVQPNAGHLALAEFERRHPGRLTVITQNVDGLHQRAGSTGVLALHGSLEEGVRLGDIWSAWHEAVPDPARLAARLGWRKEVINTISNYRDVDTCYSFPTLEEARALVGDFEIVSTRIPDYELGQRCPTLVMRPK